MSLRNMMTKRKQRIEHPFARYNATGNLVCDLCSTQVKHEQLWAAHLTSKTHRANVQSQQRQMQEAGQRKKEEMAAARQRQAEEQESRKRAAEDDSLETSSKRQRIDGIDDEDGDAEMSANPETANLPADFFDKPVENAEKSNENDEEDEEWAAFERDILAEPVASTSALPPPITDFDKAAFLSAKPRLVDEDGEEIKEEKPTGPVYNADGTYDEPDFEIPGESEAEKQEREEREELMSRIEEEEREQLEADQRVASLKNRIDYLRKKRQAK